VEWSHVDACSARPGSAPAARVHPALSTVFRPATAGFANSSRLIRSIPCNACRGRCPMAGHERPRPLRCARRWLRNAHGSWRLYQLGSLRQERQSE
jgi:hypothetical protein